MPVTWIFALGTGCDGNPRWYWTRNAASVIESVHPTRSFEECVQQAMKVGFDFTQPYHLTTIR